MSAFLQAKEALAESLQELERKKAAVQRCGMSFVFGFAFFVIPPLCVRAHTHTHTHTPTAGKIGTSSDSPQVREKLKQATDDAKKCATQCTTDLRALKRAGRAPGSDGAVVSRMEETVVKAISDFKKASQDAARQEQAANNAERSHAHEDEDDHDEGAGLLTGQQTFQRRAVEVQYNDEIAAMRQGEIEDIEQTVVEIHDIFRDLDQIVNDGTEQLEQIEENVGRGADAVVEGNKQLRQVCVGKNAVTHTKQTHTPLHRPTSTRIDLAASSATCFCSPWLRF